MEAGCRKPGRIWRGSLPVFERNTVIRLVEVCFMSRLGPHFPEVFEKCVNLGATKVLVIPYFLHSGLHLVLDVPEMLQEQAQKFPGVTLQMGRGFGFDEMLVDLVQTRIEETRSFRT